jgi:hypothetical protein
MGVRISDLLGAAPLAGPELVEIEQGGNSRKARVQDWPAGPPGPAGSPGNDAIPAFKYKVSATGTGFAEFNVTGATLTISCFPAGGIDLTTFFGALPPNTNMIGTDLDVGATFVLGQITLVAIVLGVATFTWNNVVLYGAYTNGDKWSISFVP